MSPRLRAYLDLERAARTLGADPLADAVRSTMDLIWLGLSDEEREALNRQGVTP